jgi:hypothetical protein
MDDGPRQGERSTLAAAHQRRARIIAKMHEQAIAAANAHRLPPQTADIARRSRWREADGIIAAGILKIIAVSAFVALLGCILVFGR